jgi:outer membrane biosynthesis protein TonB
MTPTASQPPKPTPQPTEIHPATHPNPPHPPPQPTPQPTQTHPAKPRSASTPHPRNPPRNPTKPRSARIATPQPREAQTAQSRREAHRENRGLMGERESKERKQKESRGRRRCVFLFWKMVYGKIFRKPFSLFSLMILRSNSNVFC